MIPIFHRRRGTGGNKMKIRNCCGLADAARPIDGVRSTGPIAKQIAMLSRMCVFGLAK